MALCKLQQQSILCEKGEYIMKQTFKVYEYPIKHPDGHIYMGSYTIKEGVKPLGKKDEKLVQKFTADALGPGEVNVLKVNSIAQLAAQVGVSDEE